jgi:two-component system, OmpR family, KDP operon response regulator KdpE
MPATNAPSVLVFEDVSPRPSYLLTALENLGYDPHKAVSASDAAKKVALGVYDLVILDLPELQQTSALLKQLRSRSTVPVIVISASSDVEERIDILNGGADDLIVRPFDLRELLARANAILRRVGRSKVKRAPLSIADVTIDFGARQVKRGEAIFKLSAKEGRLLKVLAAQLGNIVSQQVLIAQVWGERHLDDRDYLRVLIRKIRKKIEQNPENPQILLNERGVGYRLANPSRTTRTRKA